MHACKLCIHQAQKIVVHMPSIIISIRAKLKHKTTSTEGKNIFHFGLFHQDSRVLVAGLNEAWQVIVIGPKIKGMLAQPLIACFIPRWGLCSFVGFVRLGSPHASASAYIGLLL